MKSTPFFTIVIPVLNEEEYLPQLLNDLKQQTNQDFAVVVVDGNSEDQTVQKTLAFEATLPSLQIVHTKTRNVSHQRNLGAKAANSPWIIFMDADNKLPDYFLDGIKYQLARNKSTDLFSTLIKTDATDPLDTAVEHVINITLELYVTLKQQQGFGAMIGCKKSVFTEIQFDEETKYLEDSGFIQACIAQGYSYHLFRQPRYFYSLRRIKKEGTLAMIRKGASIQLDFLKGKRTFTDDRYPMLGGAYYSEKQKGLLSQVDSLNSFLKEASKKQLDQVRKVLKKVTFDID